MKISNSTSLAAKMSLRIDTSRPASCSGAIGRRARADVVDFIGDARQPEIRDAHPPLAIDHHVRGLQVAVQHALFVRRRVPAHN